jgi:hypothetical protein
MPRSQRESSSKVTNRIPRVDKSRRSRVVIDVEERWTRKVLVMVVVVVVMMVV